MPPSTTAPQDSLPFSEKDSRRMDAYSPVVL
jgi:hypothetical protein